MKASPLSLPTLPKTAPTGARKALGFTFIGLYIVAWVAVIWHPFTWLMAGLLLAAALTSAVQEAFSKPPHWQRFADAILMLLAVFPFGILGCFFFIYGLRPLWH